MTTPDPINTLEGLPIWMGYITALGPLLIFLGAVLAASVAWRNLHHRRQQDRKDEWWRRTQWALDRALSDDPTAQDVAISVLAIQADHATVGEQEDLIIIAVTDDILERIAGRADHNDPAIDYSVDTTDDEDGEA